MSDWNKFNNDHSSPWSSKDVTVSGFLNWNVDASCKRSMSIKFLFCNCPRFEYIKTYTAKCLWFISEEVSKGEEMVGVWV